MVLGAIHAAGPPLGLVVDVSRGPGRAAAAAGPVAAGHPGIVPDRRPAPATSSYPLVVPRYDFRCRACGTTFEVSRPMSDAGLPATCPAGHEDTVKLLSTVSVTGSATQVSAGPAPSGGGCCGGGCCG